MGKQMSRRWWGAINGMVVGSVLFGATVSSAAGFLDDYRLAGGPIGTVQAQVLAGQTSTYGGFGVDGHLVFRSGLLAVGISGRAEMPLFYLSASVGAVVGLAWRGSSGARLELMGGAGAHLIGALGGALPTGISGVVPYADARLGVFQEFGVETPKRFTFGIVVFGQTDLGWISGNAQSSACPCYNGGSAWSIVHESGRTRSLGAQLVFGVTHDLGG